MTIKAIIFDVGGVLIRTEDQTSRRQLEQRLGLQPGESETLVFNSPMGQQAQLGQCSTEDLWRWVQGKLALSDEALAAFQRDFWGGDRLNEPLLTLIRSLHGPYQTAIISNALDNLLHVVTDLYPMADAFDLIVGSAYEKVMKPDPIIFERVLAQLEVAPAEAVFVDDFAHNIAGAQAVGLHGIHYTPATDVAAELAALGVRLPGDHATNSR